jgi:hypothetical protein
MIVSSFESRLTFFRLPILIFRACAFWRVQMLSKSVGSAVRAAHHAGLVSKFSTSHSHHHIAPTAAEIAAARKEDVHLANQGGSYERPYVSATWLSKNLDQVHLLDVSWRMDRSSPTTKEYVLL